MSLKSGKPATVSELPSHDPPRIDLTQSAISHEDPPRNEPSRNAPPHNAPSQPKAARADLTYKDNSYSAQREQSDRARRRAAPEFQDGSYGFEQKEDRMEVDNDDRRDSYYGRQRQYGRGRHVGQPREERRLYSDDLYPGPRGRGFR